MTHIQRFIQSHPDTWEQLLTSDPYNLKISRDSEYILFKYNQLSSDFSQPIVQEARGIIFHESTWKCVRRAFDKFFNYGENNATLLDWSTVQVQEKIDGSLVSAWQDATGNWKYSTNGTINMWNAVLNDITYKSFGDVFEAALRNNELTLDDLDKLLMPGICYTFELVSPQTRVVIPYEKPDLYLIGCRDMTTMQELDPVTYGELLPIKLPKTYNISSLEEAIRAAEKLPWDEEGYVAVDCNFNRVKIKSPEWIKAHYVRGNNSVSLESLVQVILDGEQNEFLTYANDYKDKLDDVESRMNYIWDSMLNYFNKIRGYEQELRKDFARKVKEYPTYAQDFLFTTYDTKFVKLYTSVNWNASKWSQIIENLSKYDS